MIQYIIYNIIIMMHIDGVRFTYLHRFISLFNI